jgi:hypothetical protein
LFATFIFALPFSRVTKKARVFKERGTWGFIIRIKNIGEVGERLKPAVC